MNIKYFIKLNYLLLINLTLKERWKGLILYIPCIHQSAESALLDLSPMFCPYINPEMENKLTSHGFLTQRRNYSCKQKRDNLFSRTPEGSHCALLSTHYTYAVNRLAAICGRVPPISSLNHSGLARSSDDGRMQGDRQQAQVEIRKDGVY